MRYRAVSDNLQLAGYRPTYTRFSTPPNVSNAIAKGYTK
jgi:hypothetical protein